MKNRMYIESPEDRQNPHLLLTSFFIEEKSYPQVRKHKLLFPTVAYYYGRAIA